MKEWAERRKLLRAALPGLIAVGLIALTAGLADRFTGPPSDRHALLLTALVAGTGLATWQVTKQARLASLGALTVGLWAIPHAVHRQQLWVAALPLALLLVPAGWLQRVRDPALALLATLFATIAAFGLSLGIWSTALAGAGAFLIVLARPKRPTQETLGALRTASLLLPGSVLLLLVAVNAGTGWFEQPSGAGALITGLGLLGLLALVGLSGLGLATLLASSDPSERTAWVASGLGIVLFLFVTPERDIGLLQVTAAHALAPLVVLATVAAARLEAEATHRWWSLLLPIAAVAAQLGWY